MDVQLHDFIPDYLPQNDPGFLDQFASKVEFDLPSPLSEEITGELLQHQKLLLRMMLEYDRVLYRADPGTGKTRAAAAVAEHYYQNRSMYKKCIWITSTNLKQGTQKDIVEGNVYHLTDVINKQKRAEQRKRFITAELSKWYSFYSYHEFQEAFNALQTIEAKREFVSDSIIVADEIQSYRNAGLQSELVKQEEDILGRKKMSKREKLNRDITMEYWALHEACHLAERSKYILLSGTVLVNSEYDIIAPMNLLNPLDLQLNRQMIDNATLESMRPYLAGKILYLRAGIVGVDQEYVGERLNRQLMVKGKVYDSSMIIDRTPPMRGIQKQVYDMYDAAATYIEAEQRKAFTAERINANGFVFPDGSVGGRVRIDGGEQKLIGIGRYIFWNAERKEFTLTSNPKDAQDFINAISPKLIGNHGIKIEKLLQIIEAAGLTIQSVQNVGNNFGIVCLSTSFKRANSIYEWRCKHGLKWNSSVQKLKNSIPCSECSQTMMGRIYRFFTRRLWGVSIPKMPSMEKAVYLYGLEKGIAFQWQATFPECKYKAVLRFDFYFPQQNLLVELQGEQHIFPLSFFGGEETFKVRQECDKIKVDFAAKSGKRLLCIPYSDRYKVCQIMDAAIYG